MIYFIWAQRYNIFLIYAIVIKYFIIILISPNDWIFSLFYKYFLHASIAELNEVKTFIQKELGNVATSMVIESDLTRIITMLAQVDWSTFDQIKIDNDFQIDTKIDHNDLIKSKVVIKEYNIYLLYLLNYS